MDEHEARGGCHPQGDAFRDYVVARSPALLRTAYLLTGSRADAEDLLQTALAKTYLAWDRIRDREALDGYVRRVMVNTQTSFWRRRRVDESPSDVLPEAGTGRDATTASTCTTGCGPRSRGCPRSSARRWCCATTRTCPRRRRPGSWACPSAP